MARRPLSTPEAAGFGNCRRCPYLQTGTAAICYCCARRTIEHVSPDRCMTCDHPLPQGQERCGNPLCKRSPEEREWEFVWAIAMRTGALDRAIKAHKYAGKWGWSLIFGRVLVGYLNANRDTFEDFDVIIPAPPTPARAATAPTTRARSLAGPSSRTTAGRSGVT